MTTRSRGYSSNPVHPGFQMPPDLNQLPTEGYLILPTVPTRGYLQTSYRYGKERCLRRLWTEWAFTGQKEGQLRLCAQTTHPSFNGVYTRKLQEEPEYSNTLVQLHLDGLLEQVGMLWNKVHWSSYYAFACWLAHMKEGVRNDHVVAFTLTATSKPLLFSYLARYFTMTLDLGELSPSYAELIRRYKAKAGQVEKHCRKNCPEDWNGVPYFFME